MTIRMLLKLGHQRIIHKRYEQQQERNTTGKPTSRSLMQADIPMIKSLNWHQAKDWWSSLETTSHLSYPQLWTNWFWGGILLQVPNRRSLLAALIPFWEHLHQDNHSSTIQLGLWGTWTIWYCRISTICRIYASVHLCNWKTDSPNVHLTTSDCSGWTQGPNCANRLLYSYALNPKPISNLWTASMNQHRAAYHPRWMICGQQMLFHCIPATHFNHGLTIHTHLPTYLPTY